MQYSFHLQMSNRNSATPTNPVQLLISRYFGTRTTVNSRDIMSVIYPYYQLMISSRLHTFVKCTVHVWPVRSTIHVSQRLRLRKFMALRAGRSWAVPHGCTEKAVIVRARPTGLQRLVCASRTSPPRPLQRAQK